MSDAIIIGAGAAGLMAARELVRAGRTVVVLEASHRIGGRILTQHVPAAGLPVEVGAEFVHGAAPETTRLLDEARLATIPVLGQHYRSDRGELAPQGAAWSRMAKVFDLMSSRRKVDRSFQEFLDGRPGGARLSAEREMALAFVQGFNGADASLISERSLAEQGDPTEGAAEARRIVHGYAALVDHLARDVRGVIRTGVAASRIAWEEGRVRVLDRSGAEHVSRAAIVTVPLPLLQNDGLGFEPEIPTLRRAARLLVMGHVQRVSVVVRERFWEEKAEAISYVHAPRRPFNVWWTQHPLQATLLTGWSGGPPALALAERGDVEGAAIGELARVFRMRRQRVDAMVESIHRHDWSADPLVRGAYSYVGVGGMNAPQALARGIEGTLFFAGEATSAESSGTVEGALASGKRAARQLLRRMAR